MPLLVRLTVHNIVPASMSTVPKLLKLIRAALVPGSSVFLKVPTLSKRYGELKLMNEPAPCCSKSAPAQLVNTALLKTKLPAPVHRVVPPFSKVRLRLTLLGLLILSVAPGGMTVRPLPVILPAVQFIALLMVTTPLPSSEKPDKSRFDSDKSVLARSVPPFIRYSPAPLSCAPAASVSVPLFNSVSAPAGTLNGPLESALLTLKRLVVPGASVTRPVLVRVEFHDSVPASMSTVPKLLKGMLMLFVPRLSVLRKVPALSTREL